MMIIYTRASAYMFAFFLYILGIITPVRMAMAIPHGLRSQF